MPGLLWAPLPLCWIAFTTMRWKCGTVWWVSCPGLCRGVEVCLTHLQRLRAAPRTAAEDCYDSFPLRAQESIFSPRHFYSSSVTLIFPFPPIFLPCCHSSNLDWVFGVWKTSRSVTFYNNTWQVQLLSRVKASYNRKQCSQASLTELLDSFIKLESAPLNTSGVRKEEQTTGKTLFVLCMNPAERHRSMRFTSKCFIYTE